MKRRIRSPKGARGAASTGTRGGRGRGRARGGAKGRSGRGGGKGKPMDSNDTGNSSPSASDCVNIILKDNHHRSASNHFNRVPNGSVSYGREPVLQLGSIPRRPFMGPAQHNGNNNYNNNNNNNNVNNNGGNGNDFYLHKKFKKVTATVDPVPSTSEASANNIGGAGSNSLPEAASTNSSSGVNSGSANSSSSTVGMVYKPKFRIKSEMEAAQAAQQEPPSPSSKPLMALLSPREKASSLATATSAPEGLSPKPMTYFSTCGDVASDIHARVNCITSGGSNVIVNSSSILVSNKNVVSPCSSSKSSSSNHSSGHPAKLTKEKRLDRKSLDDRISKIIDENQSILEWPEQFTKMLKNHTSRGQSNHQRTSHLLSGGCTTELPASSPSSTNLLSHHQQPNGILRHSSTSSEMSTSGGSVELLPTTPFHHHSLLNGNGLGSSRSGADAFTFRHSLSNPEIHDFSLSCGGTSLSSVPAPTDLSFGAHCSSSTVTTIVRPSSASSTGSASSSATTSSVVPKKRRRLSPTPSRLCGGEVSELPVNQPAAGNKNCFQDVDMTVRVSNCGPSGAKVTIRTNNSSVSGGSVQSTSGGIMAPVDFTKIIDTVPSPHAISKPANGAIFFPGPGPSTPSTILAGNKPLSLVSKHKTKCDFPGSGVSPKGSLLVTNSGVESHKSEKGSRGRPPRKKSVPESTAIDCTTTMSSGASLLCLVQPPSEIPSRPDSSDSTASPLLRSPPTSFQNMFASSSAISLLTTSVTQNKFASHSNASEVMTMSPSHLQRSAYNDNAVPSEAEQSTPSKPMSGSPTLKSENFSPETETPFQVVPTPTQNPKRPTFLALKPVNTNSKKTEPGVLPSPETPRVAKPYNQMTINGQAYTYLGFKVSTRSSYTCLFKTQPMFIPQETDPKLSMYTNWQPRPRDPNQLQIGISTNDSRVNGRKSPHNILYTSAYGKNCDTLTVSSPGNQPPISSPICETKTFLSGIETKVSSSISQSISPIPSTSSSRTELTQPINIQVSPTPSSGIVPISPPSDSSSPVSFVSSNNLGVGSGGLMSIAAFSPKAVSSVMNLSSRDSKRGRCTPPVMSSSDTNSVDESSNGFTRRRSILKGHDDDDGESSPSEGPLALTGSRDDGNEDSRYESNRVKIMEGGFESNEDYTYVRGRGRGRYVCEACGIRCKKPSMLRKHLKTHTDLRPYTCKLCNFSFKTKGNLTKHQKSKSHHKKCAGLGIHPESSTSLAMTGPAFSISDTNTTDDNDSDDDFDGDNDLDETDSQDECEDGDSADGIDGHDNGSESVEKEIAQSLLDLSKGTVRLPSRGSASSDYESSNDAKIRGRQSSFPYTSMIEDISNSSAGSYTTGGDSIPVPETPIDLRVSKPASDKRSFEPDLLQTESDSKRIKIEKNGLIKAVGVVKEAEAWEPAVDEGSRCLNLRRVLNNTESDPISTPDSRIPPEVKTEVLEVSPSSCDSRLLYGPRQRTESETSNGSATSSSFVARPITHSVDVPSVTGKRLSSITPPPQSQAAANSSSGSVRLHQPWLSPKEAKEKKELDAKSSVSPIDMRPVNVPVDVAPAPSFKPVEEVELPQRDIPISLPSSSTAPPLPVIESGIGGVSSPSSKLFSGLPALKPQAEFRQPSGAQALVKDEGKAECNVCGKTFSRASQLTLHMNIHYIERPFRCDPCGVSFRTKGHLIKHRRSSSHDCKVYLTEAWGVANEENPRPFKCPDCKIAFRIHGHLAKHLRSKMHIMRMECLGKLPFGIYFEMEKSGINLNEIDTTDCDMSLVSLQNVARKIYGEQWRDRLTVPVEEPPV